jgi:hypothetical protein
MRRRVTLKDAQRLAKKKGGKCLALEIPNSRTPIPWQCAEGHKWSARYNDIQQRKWCPYCNGNAPITLEDAYRLAKKEGWECLAKEIPNANTLILWLCPKGHERYISYGKFRLGRRCAICSGRAPITLEDAQRLARKKGGKCLASKIPNNGTPIPWQCAEGHKWSATYDSIQQGSWCPYCAGIIPITKEDLDKVAAKHGGKCLSKEAHGANAKYDWQCAKGHKWLATYHNIQQDHWCPYCNGNAPITKENLDKVAAEHGGKCLSKEVHGANIKYEWQCAEKHKPWWATYGNIQQGGWCPICKESKGEFQIASFLNSYQVPYDQQYPIPGTKLRFDFAISDFTGEDRSHFTFIEFQGQQHYGPVRFGGVSKKRAYQNFLKTQKRDQKKERWARKHGHWLIKIKYNQDVFKVLEKKFGLKKAA